MNQQLLPLILGAGLALIVGGIIVWLLTRRIAKPGPRRNFLRVALMAVITALVGLGSLSIVNTQAASGAVAALVPAETMVVSTGDMSVSLTASGALVPAAERTLVFEISAPVSEVLVQLGDMVTAGQVLAQLDTTDIEAEIRTAEIALAEAQANRDALVAPARDIDIRISEASIEAAQASMSSAAEGPSEIDIEIARLETELEKNQLWQTQINRDVQLEAAPEFRGQNAYAQEITTNAGVEQQELSVQIAQTEYESTLTEGPDASALASANAQLESAQAELDTLLNGPTEAELRKADIDIETAQLNLANAQKRLDKAVLVSPIDGMVASETLTVGSVPLEDEAAITLLDLSQFTVSLDIDETDIVELELGQTVQLDIQALDDAVVTGKITDMDLAPTVSGELVTYTTDVKVDPTSAALRPGMSAVATIVLEQLDDVIKIPNRFITTDSATQQTMVMVEVAPGQYQPTPVTLGLRTLEESQVVAGLAAGQTIVILSSTEEDSETIGGLRFPGLGGGGAGPAGGVPGGGPPPG